MRKRIPHTLLSRLLGAVINLLFVLCILFILWVIIQVFFLTSFTIPTHSMKPTLIQGDKILVSKITPGPRLFNVLAAVRDEQVTIKRLPGRRIKRNDVIVFNFPYAINPDRIGIDIMVYHAKRCIGLPGDTIYIEDGISKIKGIDLPLGNLESQKRIGSGDPSFLQGLGILNSSPEYAELGWNILNFGPIYIPSKGDTILMDRQNAVLYKKLIEWERNASLLIDSSGDIWLDNEPLPYYVFQGNYYFVTGDRVSDSQDSRYWGLLPEEFIVGKAWLVWKSIDPLTSDFRWDRFMKVIE